MTTGRRVGLCSIGSEVVSGEQLDTNASWLGRRLHEIGLEPWTHLALPDELDELIEGLGWLVARSDAIVTGGGLGPTSDDLTREAIAKLAGVELRSDPALEEALIQAFAARGVRMPASNLRQARLPAGAVALEPVGTAAGIRLEISGTLVIALPGVPWELEAMAERDVLPLLQERFGTHAVASRTVRVVGMSEAALGELVDPVSRRSGVGVSYLAGQGEVRVVLTVHDEHLDRATRAVEAGLEAVVAALGPRVAGIDGVTLEETVLDLLVSRGETVAMAESATAGDVCSRLAAISGAARALRGGLVVYAADLKSELAGVPPELVATYGPVSAQVTRALAAGVREQLDADWGLATTGVAGPDAQDGVEAGTVHWAVAGPDGQIEAHSAQLPGDRATVRGRLGSAVFETLRRQLLAGPPG